MSRVGKLPITVPSGVNLVIDGSRVNVSGPKGKLDFTVGQGIKVTNTDGKIIVVAKGESKQAKADYGTARAIINNMVKGVTTGWKKSLELNGVGFNAKVNGKNLVLSVGFSHDVEFAIPNDIQCAVTKNTIELQSANKELVGTFAAKIRITQPPEPYLGKGIKYADEKIRRKAGKAGKK